MYQVVVIEGKRVPMLASGLTYRLYRHTFHKDLFATLKDIDQTTKGKEADEFDDYEMSELLNMVEQLAWTLAKCANKEIPEINEWLNGFNDPYAILSVSKKVTNMLRMSSETSVELKKNQKKKKKNKHKSTSTN